MRRSSLQLVGSALACGIALLALAACDLHRSEGERLWRKLCADCHGLDGRGNTPRYLGNPYADLTDSTWHASADEAGIETVIRQGVFGEMPRHDELTREQMKALIEYVYKLRHERR